MTDPVMLLSRLHGEGRVTFRALRAAGFYTLASIAEAPVQTLADRAHLSARTARRLKTGAEEMVGNGIGLESPDAGSTASRTGGLRAGGRNSRRAPIAFSEGVLPEEAALLGAWGDDRPIPPLESSEPAEPSLEEPDPPEQPTVSIDVGSRIAAAAEAAAGLSRPATPAPPASGEATPSEPGRTFWGFG